MNGNKIGNKTMAGIQSGRFLSTLRLLKAMFAEIAITVNTAEIGSIGNYL